MPLRLCTLQPILRLTMISIAIAIAVVAFLAVRQEDKHDTRTRLDALCFAPVCCPARYLQG